MRILLIYLDPLDNEPIGLMYIGTALKREGHEVKLIGVENRRRDEKLLTAVSEFKAEIVGISVTTPYANKAESVANTIKRYYPHVKIIAGGPHPTILPQHVIKGRTIDIAVMGEGEVTVVELIRSLAQDPPSLEKVNGIAFLRDGEMVITGKREFIRDIDELPFVDRELLPMSVVCGRAGYPIGNPTMFIMTVRGCPYRCKFCQPTVERMFGHTVRRRSPENVVKEIMELKRRYSVGGIWINDDTFSHDYRWTVRFCDLLVEKKLWIMWFAASRINRARKDILIKMRDAGCAGVIMAMEAGSERVRNEVLNKNVSNAQVLKAYSICHEIGLPVQGNIMLGTPTETEEELQESLSLIATVQPHFINTAYTTPLPGTPLFEEYLQGHTIADPYKNWEEYDLGVLKSINCKIPKYRLKQAREHLGRFYSLMSPRNRARHFFQYPYFRRILYRRWRSLVFSKHPKFGHLIYDMALILIGSYGYFRDRKSYIRRKLAM